MPVAVGPAELSTLLLVLCVVIVPVAAVAFARSGKGLEDLGKGRFSVDREEPSAPGSAPPPLDPADHEEEVRQMVEAAAFRRSARGEAQLDIEAEIDRLLSGEAGGPGAGDDTAEDAPAEPPPGDGGVRDEIRQLVIANNERRERRGEDPLDVESEVDRRLREWT